MSKTFFKKIFAVIVFVVCIMALKSNNVNATITISCADKIDVGDTLTVTVDFGTYVGAYDLLEVSYNSRILTNTSVSSLIEKYWFDTSEASTGLRYKTYTFTGKKNGTLNIGVTVKGLVSANSTMDELGDFYVYKQVVVGNGIEAGDINQDGYINSTDAAMILDKYKNGNITEDDLIRGDMNDDGLLNSTDAAIILDVYKNS